jgi:hypothetical protein
MAIPSHEMVEVEHGALLLDLQSGQIMRLNRSATLVWQRHLAGASLSEIADELSQLFGLERSNAARDTAVALDMPPNTKVPQPASEFRYERLPSRYRYLRTDQPIFDVHDDGSVLALVAPHATRDELRMYLRNVAPKILSLRGHVVLHAAAVAIGSSVLALAGESGAGKTTTARAMVAAGARAVAEDKLILTIGNAEVRAAMTGEALIQAWVEQALEEIVARGIASCEGLDRATQGPSSPLLELGFLDVSRRRPGPVRARGLAILDSSGAVFQRAFLLSDATGEWIRHLRSSVAIASAVAAYELEMPGDLDTLAKEAKRLVERGSMGNQPALG